MYLTDAEMGQLDKLVANIPTQFGMPFVRLFDQINFRINEEKKALENKEAKPESLSSDLPTKEQKDRNPIEPQSEKLSEEVSSN